MIGNPNWFERRKYGGWGLTPKTKAGWIYIFVFMIPPIIFSCIPDLAVKTRIIGIAVWATILFVDVFDIMRKLKHDEREKIHEAISERNALWGIILVLTAGFLYEIIKNSLDGIFKVNPFIAGALIVGLLIKTISNIYLDKKN